MARWPDSIGGVDRGWISTRDADIIANRIKQRAVVRWEMVGASSKGGHRVAGYVRLHLEGGGWMWFPERTNLNEAIAKAEDHGFSVTDIKAQLEEWVRTGKGATFSLERK